MKFINYIISLIKKALDDNIMVYAAQSAYYLMLSSIPFIMILISVIQFFIPLDSGIVFRTASSLMPSNFHNFLSFAVDEFFSKPAISFVSFSAMTTLWSASRGFAAMERGIRSIYRLPKRSSFIMNILLSFVYTIVFVIMLLLFLLLIVFGKSVINLINIHITLSFIDVHIFRYIIFLVMAIIFFTAIYAGLSSRQFPIRSHLPGAVFTSLGWVLFSFIFSLYINNFSNYSRIYGSLTAIVLMMLWLYSCMTILLFGAKINTELMDKRKDTKR